MFFILFWGAASCDRGGPPHIDDARPVLFSILSRNSAAELFFSLVRASLARRHLPYRIRLSLFTPSPSVLLYLIHVVVDTSEYSGFNQRCTSVHVVCVCLFGCGCLRVIEGALPTALPTSVHTDTDMRSSRPSSALLCLVSSACLYGCLCQHLTRHKQRKATARRRCRASQAVMRQTEGGGGWGEGGGKRVQTWRRAQKRTHVQCTLDTQDG